MTAARWLVRVAAIAALNRFNGCGLALSVRSRVTGVLDLLVSIGGGSSGGVGKDTVADIAATPVVGVAGGGHIFSASLLLSSLRLALLARSRLLLPEWCTWAWVAASAAAGLPPADVERNQRLTSSDVPSVSNTSLAGNPSSLQRTHAIYWLCAHGGGRGVEPV